MKSNKTRVCTDIPSEWSELAKKYNENATKPFVFSRIAYRAIEKEINVIIKEME